MLIVVVVAHRLTVEIGDETSYGMFKIVGILHRWYITLQSAQLRFTNDGREFSLHLLDEQTSLVFRHERVHANERANLPRLLVDIEKASRSKIDKLTGT